MTTLRIVCASLIVLIVVLNCSVPSVSQMERPYRKDVCELNARAFDPKIVCHCEQLKTHNGRISEYKKADCWLHGSDLREDDVAWDGFGRSTNIQELSFVVFTDDHLHFLPQKGMYYLTDMTKFSLGHADIPQISPYAFSKLQKLEEISLVANNINTIDEYAFHKLENLRSLNLSFNQITYLHRDVFYKNYKMELLHLSVNNITSISDGAFGDLSNLIELRLDFNLIQRITSSMLRGLTSLKKFTMAGNYISLVDEDTLEHMPELEYLDLSQNALQFIAVDAFKWNPRLGYIDLERNELKHLDANLFRSMPNLGYLNVGKNLLTTLEVDRDRFMVERFVNETTALFMHENNFLCDCRLLWVYELRNRSRSGTVQKSLDNMYCDLIERADEKPVVVYLLQLHYENFDCAATMATTTQLSVPFRDGRLRVNGAPGGGGIWQGSGGALSAAMQVVKVQNTIIALLVFTLIFTCTNYSRKV